MAYMPMTTSTIDAVESSAAPATGQSKNINQLNSSVGSSSYEKFNLECSYQ
jgi:hypothetical protein